MAIEFARLLGTKLGQRVRTVLAQVALFGAEGDDANAEQAENCEVFHPVGFVSRPASGSATAEAVVIREGYEVHVLCFVDKNDTVHDCPEGGAEMYSPKEPSCRVRVMPNGDVEIIPKNGQKVYVGAPSGTGGMQPVGLGTSIKTQLDEIRSKFATHIHPASGSIVISPTATLINATPDVEADNVNVK